MAHCHPIIKNIIYPLRGTNKPIQYEGYHRKTDLSPTGDEQTYSYGVIIKYASFIPYGGRTNPDFNALTLLGYIYPLRGTNEHDNLHRLSTRHIYPLRGTNKQPVQWFQAGRTYLSPTGDEQTFPPCIALTQRKFIPYGGRTNHIAETLKKSGIIYPLRGTNKPGRLKNFANLVIYPLRGTNKLQ